MKVLPKHIASRRGDGAPGRWRCGTLASSSSSRKDESFDGGVWNDCGPPPFQAKSAPPAGDSSAARNKSASSRDAGDTFSAFFWRFRAGGDATAPLSTTSSSPSDESDPSKAASTAAWRRGDRRGGGDAAASIARRGAGAGAGTVLPACLRGDRRGISRDDDDRLPPSRRRFFLLWRPREQLPAAAPLRRHHHRPTNLRVFEVRTPSPCAAAATAAAWPCARIAILVMRRARAL